MIELRHAPENRKRNGEAQLKNDQYPLKALKSIRAISETCSYKGKCNITRNIVSEIQWLILVFCILLFWLLKGPRLHTSATSGQIGLFIPFGVRSDQVMWVHLISIVTLSVLNFSLAICTSSSVFSKSSRKAKNIIFSYAIRFFLIIVLVEVFILNPVTTPLAWYWSAMDNIKDKTREGSANLLRKSARIVEDTKKRTTANIDNLGTKAATVLKSANEQDSHSVRKLGFLNNRVVDILVDINFHSIVLLILLYGMILAALTINVITFCFMFMESLCDFMLLKLKESTSSLTITVLGEQNGTTKFIENASNHGEITKSSRRRSLDSVKGEINSSEVAQKIKFISLIDSKSEIQAPFRIHTFAGNIRGVPIIILQIGHTNISVYQGSCTISDEHILSYSMSKYAVVNQNISDSNQIDGSLLPENENLLEVLKKLQATANIHLILSRHESVIDWMRAKMLYERAVEASVKLILADIVSETYDSTNELPSIFQIWFDYNVSNEYRIMNQLKTILNCVKNFSFNTEINQLQTAIIIGDIASSKFFNKVIGSANIKKVFVCNLSEKNISKFISDCQYQSTVFIDGATDKMSQITKSVEKNSKLTIVFASKSGKDFTEPGNIARLEKALNSNSFMTTLFKSRYFPLLKDARYLMYPDDFSIELSSKIYCIPNYT